MHTMTQVLVASTNPVKTEATKAALAKIFPSESFDLLAEAVETSVPDQPMSNEQTLSGARLRAEQARSSYPDLAYWVGIEGGVEQEFLGMASFAWVYILDKNGKKGFGKSATFYLPHKVAELVQEGKELGEADDIVFGHAESKTKQGAIGILTNNVITRTDLYIQAVVTALIPFSKSALY